MDLGLVVPMFNQGDDPIACLNKAMDFLTAVASLRFSSTNNQLRTSSNPRNQATIHDIREDRQGWLNVIIIKIQAFQYDQAAQTTIPNTTALQTNDLDACDSDCDDVSNVKAVSMANLSNYGLDVILEVPHFELYHTDMDNQSVHA
ncbi:hypothetical protein Tco_1380914, partial [Tanacetum coccineum]